jgi:threonylcarbamoyladenosine tRNA methylthiotransferase MtaB
MFKKETNKVITFGCRLNIYESQVIHDLLEKSGTENTIVMNTCAVTAEAERQAFQTIRRTRRENPNHKIIVTGCAAQINPEKFANLSDVDQVIGNQEKLKLESFSPSISSRILVQDIMKSRETSAPPVSTFDGKTRAFVEIQNGCNHRCTFCRIPYGRGNSRSVPLRDILSQIQHLVDRGIPEVILTGVDITSYGEDFSPKLTLGMCVERILDQIPSLRRLRLSSIDPVEFDETLWQVFATNPRLMPHVHISLQAGDDLILKRMKRRHLRQDVIDFFARMRSLRPDIVFGADIIAGFPTETEEMFQNSLNLIEECAISFLHVFPFSPHKETPASRMPQVNRGIIKERAARLRQKGEDMKEKLFTSMIGKHAEIVVEKDHTGLTEHFASVLPDRTLEPGTLAQVKITGKTSSHLLGEVLSW